MRWASAWACPGFDLLSLLEALVLFAEFFHLSHKQVVFLGQLAAINPFKQRFPGRGETIRLHHFAYDMVNSADSNIAIGRFGPGL